MRKTQASKFKSLWPLRFKSTILGKERETHEAFETQGTQA